MRFRHAWWTAPLVVLLGACSSGLGSNFKEPDFTLQRVMVRGVGVRGGSLDLVVKVDNPNGFSLRGTKLDVGFDVEDSHVGDVRYDSGFDLPSNGATTLTLPLRFDWSGVSGAFRSALAYGDLPYKLKGQATMQVSGTKVVVPFTREGRAPLIRSGAAVGSGPSRTQDREE
jgi:LEA14-like dessication related protein